ncbi:PAS domain-containing protein [Candidatus Woesebacteria bacterium]|nr:PAS domain-containing protein [Candidatus Woesebacteria bacterium]
MAHNPQHEHLIKEVAELFKPVLSKSPQAIYIYLDDEHKICNQKFAKMLGYGSPQEWVANKYPVTDVEEKDQEKVIKDYMDASRKFKSSSLKATLVRKDGKKIKTSIIMVWCLVSILVFGFHLELTLAG